MNNKLILEEWKESISKLEKIRIDEAKAIYIDILNEEDLEVKKDKISKLIEGTLYVVANYISNNDLCYLNSSSYDMNDIISVYNETWIERILDGRLLEVGYYSFVFDNLFHSLVADKLLTHKYRIHENLGITILEFSDILPEFITMKQSNYAFNINDFNKYINDSKYISDKSSKTVKTDKLYVLLDSIYNSLIQNHENIDITKRKTWDFLYLLINNGLEVSMVDINTVTCDDFTSRSDEDIFYNGMNELIFDSKLLNESRKEVLRRRYGLDPYSNGETYRKIASNMNVRHSRIRKLEEDSLKKIRKSDKIMEYLKK